MSRASSSSWPALLACGVLWILFGALNPNFLSPLNLTNLSLQVAAMAVLAAGLVPVLLLGEIDLAAGALGGLCAAVMVVLQVRAGISGVTSVLAALATGGCVGTLHGLLRARLGVPSFIVTLAGLLTWQGALLATLGDTGSVNVRDGLVVSLTSTFVPGWLGVAVALGLSIHAVWTLARAPHKKAAALGAAPVVGLAWVAAVVFALDRGVPLAAVIMVATMVVLDVVLMRTALGRHVFAVGGSVEAARRAGINVAAVLVGVFAASGVFAALGGVLSASRLLAVTQSSGAGDLLLNAIAACVMGGTSLFGGRGSALSALWGALVIGTVGNGMDLLALGSAPKFMITGAVLLLAVSMDALGRGAAKRAR